METIEQLQSDNDRLQRKCALMSAKIAVCVDLLERFNNEENRAWCLDRIARELLVSEYETWRSGIPGYETGYEP